MSKEMEKLDEILDAVQEGVKQVREALSEEVQTVQTMVSELSEQTGRLHESATGVQDGPGGREAPYSLVDIGNMLAALHLIFEPKLKEKAFELFNEEYEHCKARGDTTSELAQECIKMAASHRLGVLPGMQDRFYKEWKTQQPMK
jgi:hypothetical protein